MSTITRRDGQQFVLQAYREASRGHKRHRIVKEIKDSELIGIPLNIIVGKNYLENKEVELKGRDGKSSTNPITDIKTILDFFKDK